MTDEDERRQASLRKVREAITEEVCPDHKYLVDVLAEVDRLREALMALGCIAEWDGEFVCTDEGVADRKDWCLPCAALSPADSEVGETG